MDEAANMLVLPEGCLSDVLSLTSPMDACRAASISKGFNSAADSDAVWEQFLIPNYREIIAKAVSPLVFGSKKQLYLLLSDYHVLLDRGYMVPRGEHTYRSMVSFDPRENSIRDTVTKEYICRVSCLKNYWGFQRTCCASNNKVKLWWDTNGD
ncbi:hypothetical protein L2E82_35010 [Cichorium intybus]|uniref:Uncharacterized protein n=1 Tax=Cichorium intybus TaxID=13427 RepID=A0ACB9BN49_CICIN|nr:hypothetical protein L2E82_35010 [Cichorium intybus]